MKKTHSKIILVYALLVLSYFFSYFFRVSTSVVLPMIRNEWSLSAGIVGFISSMYYYTYALMQPMCGVLNDRIGPEKVVGFGIVITSIGSLCFGLGNTTMWLIVGRLLMGVGLSPMLSGLLVFQGTHFAPERYAFFSGLSMMIGNMGAVFSVGPLSLALHTWGRSSIFSLLSIVTLGMAAALFLVGRNPSQPKSESFKKMLRQRLALAFEVVKSSSELKRIIVIWMISFGGLMAYQGLWAVSWFKTTYGEMADHASFAASFIGIGVMIGNFLGGYLCKTHTKRHQIVARLVYTVFVAWVLTVGCFLIRAPFFLTILASTFLGMANGMAFTQLTAGVNDIAPAGQGGAVFGITNCITFTCVIVFQWGTGALIDLFSSSMGSEIAYLMTFTIVLCFLLVPCLATIGMKQFRKVEKSIS